MKDWTAVRLAKQLRGLTSMSIGKNPCNLDFRDRSGECKRQVRDALHLAVDFFLW